MRIELAPGHDGYNGRVLARAKGAEFPAVSTDGKLVAQLFEDFEDFSGAPITTFVVWSVSGTRLGAYRLGGNTVHGSEKTVTATSEEEAALRDANAWLAKAAWRPLAFHPECDGVVKLDGATLAFDPDTEQLTRKPKTKLALTFPDVGARMYDGSGPCGMIRGLVGGFGGPAIGFAVLVPHASLGGDSCFGLPTVETALAFPIR